MDDFWEWFRNLDSLTRAKVSYEMTKEEVEKNRELTAEELNEIRKKYDHDREDAADGQEQAT